jgi:four helix bundle protein
MSKIVRFEDIEAWQDARALTKEIYIITESWKDFSLKDQMRRASVSIMANTVEGYARRGDKEFSHFLFIARASAAELQSHLYLSLDLNNISHQVFDYLYEKLDKIQRKLYSFIRTLDARRFTHDA